MLIFQHISNQGEVQEDIYMDWTWELFNIEEAPSFISRQQQIEIDRIFHTSANPANLQCKGIS